MTTSSDDQNRSTTDRSPLNLSDQHDLNSLRSREPALLTSPPLSSEPPTPINFRHTFYDYKQDREIQDVSAPLFFFQLKVRTKTYCPVLFFHQADGKYWAHHATTLADQATSIRLPSALGIAEMSTTTTTILNPELSCSTSQTKDQVLNANEPVSSTRSNIVNKPHQPVFNSSNGNVSHSQADVQSDSIPHPGDTPQDDEPLLTQDLRFLYESFQACLDLRDKYIGLSKQQLHDNPQSYDGHYLPPTDQGPIYSPWKIYPDPPQPHWRSMTSADPWGSRPDENEVEAPKGFDFAACDIPGLDPKLAYQFALDDKGVYQVYAEGNVQPLYVIPTIREYFMDLDFVLDAISHGPAKSFAWRRLKFLESKWNMYVLLNEYQELADMKRVPHRLVIFCVMWRCHYTILVSLYIFYFPRWLFLLRETRQCTIVS